MQRVCANHFEFSRGDLHIPKSKKLTLSVGDEIVIGFMAYKITDSNCHGMDTDVYLFNADNPVPLSDNQIIRTFAQCPYHHAE